MKKTVVFILTLCMVLSFAACANGQTTEDTTQEAVDPDTSAPEDTAPQITVQEVYEAGKDYTALIGDHENVCFQTISNGKIIREKFLSKQYCYIFGSAEYLETDSDFIEFSSPNSEYICFENAYCLYVMITPDGIVDAKDRFDELSSNDFISSAMLDDTVVITEENGSITVSALSDMDDIVLIGDDVVSCEEIYTLDATTREMTSVRTVYTYADGSVEEGVVTITRDVEAPEGVKPFLAYEAQTENLRTVTLVTVPGAENEKTDSFQLPKGLTFAISYPIDVEENFTVYADAACTQAFEEDTDLDADLTLYVKWSE